MRVLMVSDVYFPRVNGVSTSIQTFARELTAMGHFVALIAPDYGYPHEDDERLFQRCYRVPSRYLFVDPEDRMMRRRPLFDLQPELQELDFDILHIQTPFLAHYVGVALSEALSIPRVATYHTFFEEYLYFYVPLLPRWLLKMAARRFSCAQCNNVDALVVPSSAMRDTLAGYGVTTPMSIIPTGIDGHRFNGGDGARFRDRHSIPADSPVLVHVGRVAHEKNIDFLLHVVQALSGATPEIKLIIAGEGPALGHLQALARQLGIEHNVIFVGYLDRETSLLDCYRAGDVFVFSSRTETQGLVLLEAMALGVPVVSTAIMGTKDVLVEGRGALIAEERVDEFAAQVRRVFDEPDLYRRLSAEAVNYATEWSSSAQASKLAHFYRDTMEARRSGQVAELTPRPCTDP